MVYVPFAFQYLFAASSLLETGSPSLCVTFHHINYALYDLYPMLRISTYYISTSYMQHMIYAEGGGHRVEKKNIVIHGGRAVHVQFTDVAACGLHRAGACARPCQ